MTPYWCPPCIISVCNCFLSAYPLAQSTAKPKAKLEYSLVDLGLEIKAPFVQVTSLRHHKQLSSEAAAEDMPTGMPHRTHNTNPVHSVLEVASHPILSGQVGHVNLSDLL